MDNKSLIPEGFKDHVDFNTNVEHEFKNKIIDFFISNGFDLVKTPLVEFYEKNSKNCFFIEAKKKEPKLFIRDDITPQIIRIVSSRLKNKIRPIKLCYYGEVIRKKGTMLRPERQFLQVGSEIIGSKSILADIEIISLAYKSLKEIGFNKDLKKLVIHQAKLAARAKLDGIVCSAQEVTIVKKVFKKEVITPGIRFGSKTNDQKRILTPKEAFKNGSDWLVIGRPITKGNIKKNIQKLIDHLN